MKIASWSKLKQLIESTGRPQSLFLTVIDRDGRIRCANATMVRNMELKDPRASSVNFFDLVHPAQVPKLKSAIACPHKINEDIELHVRKGYYHPMKWRIRKLSDHKDDSHFLCMGYKIADDTRVNHLNTLLRDHYHVVMEGMTALVIHDERGEMIAANQKAASIFDCTLEDLYQLTDIESLWKKKWHILSEKGHPVSFADSPFMKCIRTGDTYTQTLHIQLPDGNFKWFLFNSQPVKGGAGKPFAAISNIIDITKERELSRELDEGKVLINTFFQQTPTLAWVIDETALLQFASQAFYEHFGLTEKESIGRKITDLVPQSVSRILYDEHMQVFETGNPVQVTERVKWADGSYSISHIHLFPIHSGSGKKLVGGQAISLPDKSKLEKELKIAHERMLHMSRATSDAIWEWDMQTGQIFRNEALMEMIGYQPDHSKGLSWWLRRIHPEDRNRLADKVKEATDNFQQSWSDSYRFKCADGTYKHVEDKGFVVYENGLPVKMIGSLQDISLLKELESELADARLQKQKEISETVIRVQEKERTRIGHELHDNVNQILSTVKLFFDNIKPSGSEQQQLKQKSIEYLHLAIEEIRKLSKELVTPQLKKETLVDSILAVITDIQITGAIRISFNHQVNEEILSHGKKVTLFRIVQEQLKNILKHSQAKTTEINLRTISQAVELTIIDDGKGFDPQLTRQGIGLANIHERTHFYNGTAHVESTPGKGCLLKVSIPLEN